jgi:hypothetical protein
MPPPPPSCTSTGDRGGGSGRVLGNGNLLAEILLRVGSPTWLVHAALACKSWLRVASDPESGLPRPLPRAPSAPRPQPQRLLQQRLAASGPFPSVPPSWPPPSASPVALLEISTALAGALTTAMAAACGLDAYWDGYAVTSLLQEAPKKILPPPPPLALADANGLCVEYVNCSWLLLEDDAMSCLFLRMASNKAAVRVDFSILRSGVWGVPQSAVKENPYFTLFGQKLISGRKLFMMTGPS